MTKRGVRIIDSGAAQALTLALVLLLAPAAGAQTAGDRPFDPAEPNCNDRVQNGDETAVDCGASCGPCHCEARGQCILFLTSTTHTGNLGGLRGADAICNARAKAAGLVGTYQAWLCDGLVGPASVHRSHRAKVPYVRTDGVRIANDWADLTDGSIANTITRTERGEDVSLVPPFLPWTNVTAQGECDDEMYLSPGSGPCPPFSNCKLNCAADGGDSGWTSSSAWGQGAKGDANSTGSLWTDGVSGLCSSPEERIYCIEQ